MQRADRAEWQPETARHPTMATRYVADPPE